jgi:large subunit ribosomal protein L1
MADLTVQDIKKLKDESKRGFKETIDLAISIQGLDVKKPENRMREAIRLPHKVKDATVCFIVDGLFGLATETKRKVLSKNDLDFKKRDGIKLARDSDFFAIESPLMPAAAKALGKFIGPRNKQMIPLLPTTKDFKPFLEGLDHTVQLNITKAPTVQIPIGKTTLKDEQILENYNYVIEKIKGKLESKKAQIKSVYIKTTMGKPMKVM